jgi:hypothetical protein
MLTQDQIVHADNWRRRHRLHVQRLIEEAGNSYPPSREDASRPELWKPAHWRWFIVNA